MSSPKSSTKSQDINFLEQEEHSIARGKRTNYELRSSIQKALAEREMTLHELTIALNSSRKTVERHLIWLKELGEVKQRNIGFKNQEKHLWGLSQ